MTFEQAENTILKSHSNDDKIIALNYLIDNEKINDQVLSLAVECLKANDDRLKDLAFRLLANVGEEFKLDAMVKVAVLMTSNDIVTRNLAGELLVTVGYVSGFAISPYLKDKDDQIRQYATEMSGRFGNTDICPALYPLLEDIDINIRSCAIESLGSLKDSNSVEFLIEKYHQDEELRPIIIESLGKIGSYQVIEFLYTQLSNEEDIFNIIAIIDALSLCADSIDVVKAINNQFENYDLEVQIIALKALYVVSSRAGVEYHIDPMFRYVAHKAITDQDPDVRAAGLLSMGPKFIMDDIPFLVILTIYKELQVQEHVASTLLYNSEDKVFIEFIKKLLYNKLVNFNSVEFFTLVAEILFSVYHSSEDIIFSKLFTFLFNDFDINKEMLVRTLVDVNPDLISEVVNKLLAEEKISSFAVEEYFNQN
jgi:HEAT repeat protein